MHDVYAYVHGTQSWSQPGDFLRCGLACPPSRRLGTAHLPPWDDAHHGMRKVQYTVRICKTKQFLALGALGACSVY